LRRCTRRYCSQREQSHHIVTAIFCNHPSNPEVLFRVRASRDKTQTNDTKQIMTTMKTILLEDWDAPAFRVRINDANKCPANPRRPQVGYTPLFRTTHPEPWRPSGFHQERRRSRFAALSKA
jgi:hypothetical protein